MKTTSLTKIAIVSLALTSIVACSNKKTEENDLQQAQLCLNSATAASAKACVNDIASNTSPAANSLKCSAIFISEGYGSASSFLTAIDSINNSGSCSGGCSSTVNALTTFNFRSAGVSTSGQRDINVATATEAFSVCSATNVKFYSQIASLFKIGTLSAMIAYNTSGGAAITEDDIKTAIGSLDDATIGSLVTTTYSSVCTDVDKASDATKKYCTELQTAISAPTATPAGIGACLKAKLDDPNAVCT